MTISLQYSSELVSCNSDCISEINLTLLIECIIGRKRDGSLCTLFVIP
jgi:hypothetical protein